MATFDDVRSISMALPDVEEHKTWGTDINWRVRNKMFAMFVNDHHGDGRIALWLDAPPGDQELLVAADPVRFFVPPYQGPYGWIGVRVDLDPGERPHRHPAVGCLVAGGDHEGHPEV